MNININKIHMYILMLKNISRHKARNIKVINNP